MRLGLFLIPLLLASNSYSQELPSDSLVLKTIFGKVEKVNKEFLFIRPFREGENYESYPTDIRYSVVFKEHVKLQGQHLILVIVGAPIFNQMGHSFEYRQTFFCKINAVGKLLIVDSIISDEATLVGDGTEYQLVSIGKDAIGLLSTFQSTGNHHYEQSIGFCHLQIGKEIGMISVDTGYDNSAWISAKDDEECLAETFESSFTIIKSEKEFFDVKVHRSDYEYTMGCKEKVLKKESDSIFIYENGKYVEHKK